MAFTTKDLLIAFGSFGMALFALNLYKLTKADNGWSGSEKPRLPTG